MSLIFRCRKELWKKYNFLPPNYCIVRLCLRKFAGEMLALCGQAKQRNKTQSSRQR